MQRAAPSPIWRLVFAGYVWMLSRLPAVPLLPELEPWMALPICFLNLLALYLPSLLWASDKTNRQLYIVQLEVALQYFFVLFGLAVCCKEGANHVLLNTYMVLYFTWNMWQGGLMKLSLVFNAFMLVPVLWMQAPKAPLQGWVYDMLLCDFSWVLYQFSSLIYPALLEALF